MFNPWVLLAVVLAFAGIGYTGYVKGDKAATERINGYYAQKQVIAEQAARVEEQRRAKAQGEALNEKDKFIEVAKRDIARQRVATGELRDAIDTFISNRASDAAATGGSKAAATLGELFGHCNERYGIMADEAQAGRIAGQFCEKLYDSNITDKVKAQLGKTP